jgi:hypothetical protein
MLPGLNYILCDYFVYVEELGGGRTSGAKGGGITGYAGAM